MDQFVLFSNLDQSFLTVKSITIHTNCGSFLIKCLEFPDKQYILNDEDFENYYKNLKTIQMAIVLFDYTSGFSLPEATKYIEELRSYCGWIPYIIAANKADSLNRQITQLQIREQNLNIFQSFFDISAICNHNLDKMITKLMQLLLGDPELILLDGMNFKQHDFVINPQILNQMILEENFKMQLIGQSGTQNITQ